MRWWLRSDGGLGNAGLRAAVALLLFLVGGRGTAGLVLAALVGATFGGGDVSLDEARATPVRLRRSGDALDE